MIDEYEVQKKAMKFIQKQPVPQQKRILKDVPFPFDMWHNMT